jgi:ATP-binding cassette, subfamily C (CFTR/MRP), member 1
LILLGLEVGGPFNSLALLALTHDRHEEEQIQLDAGHFRRVLDGFLGWLDTQTALTGFSFAQPFLVNRIVDFVGRPWTELSGDTMGGLVGATAIIYIGLAVSRAWYQHLTFQLVTIFRGGLVALVFKKTLDLDTPSINDQAPVTLMSTDIDGVVTALQMTHDTWSAIPELAIGFYLLYRQVGVSSFWLLIPSIGKEFPPSAVSRLRLTRR